MWIDTDDGEVNPALVAKARFAGKPHNRVDLYAADGTHLGVTSEFDFHYALKTSLVPAAAGQEAIAVYEWTDGEGGIGGVEVGRVAVVAWKVYGSEATPVVAGANSNRILILHPDGQVEDPDVKSWPNVDAAVADITAEVKERAIREKVA